MNTEKTKLFLKELTEKSKNYEEGFFAPKECSIEISKLANYDFFVSEHLQKITRELWSSKSNYETKSVMSKVIIIEDDKIKFIPRIVREYLKELENE